MPSREEPARGSERKITARLAASDRVQFTLDARRYAAFEKLLDDFPPPSDALCALMRRKAPWES
jgi:uncharacterized protein (DUF1778 family)